MYISDSFGQENSDIHNIIIFWLYQKFNNIIDYRTDQLQIVSWNAQ